MPIPTLPDGNRSGAKVTGPPKRNTKKRDTGKARGRVSGGTKARREAGVLNPPFDPRMRRIGSPAINKSRSIKRGWIETGPTVEERQRVNFLFNPSSISHSSSASTSIPSKSQSDLNDQDQMEAYAVHSIGNVSLQLLYDRTYEMFSASRVGNNTAYSYGVWADVAAWLYYHRMLDELPKAPIVSINSKGERIVPETHWAESLFVSPQQYVFSYLRIGPRLRYYGYVDSIGVTYSHFSQHMVPTRCAVNLSFTLLPSPGSSGDGKGGTPAKPGDPLYSPKTPARTKGGTTAPLPPGHPLYSPPRYGSGEPW